MPKLLVPKKPNDTIVRTRLVQDDQTGEVKIEVSVRSNAKRGCWATVKLDPDDPKLIYKAEKAAEDAATRQCALFGDVHDFQACRKAARAGVTEIMRKAERASTRPTIQVSEAERAFQQ